MSEDKEIVLTRHQEHVLGEFCKFIDDDSTKILILKGYAGTGKTTMVKRFIAELSKKGAPFVLLASTGRAAKILSNITSLEATTVHGLIYSFMALNQDMDRIMQTREQGLADDTGQLLLQFEARSVSYEHDIYYIVDEASMISDKEEKNASQAIFGSGRLLKDLLNYNKNGKFIFVGDSCQLPPINQGSSPALSVEYLQRVFGASAKEIELTEVLRQEKGNDIVNSAQKMRYLYANPQPWTWAKFPFRNYRNIHIVDSQATLMSLYIDDVKKNGYNSATLLGYSNRQCGNITKIVRPALGIATSSLSVGDLLLVTQNNYISGLMNGDLVMVKGIGGKELRAGLTFLHVSVEELHTHKVYSQLMIADVLYQNQTNLGPEQQKELFIDFSIRMKNKGIKQNTKSFNEAMLKDSYLNALRAVYGYALTCHKAQGGEWDNVYLDIPRNLPGIQKPYVYQWIYTAMTRASKELYVVNDFWIM